MLSSSQPPLVIDDYLQSEVALGRIVLVHFSSCHTPSTCQQVWGDSTAINQQVAYIVNDGVPKRPYAVQDVMVHDFLDGIMSRGRGMLTAKFDVASAYHNVAVHPNDH